ncbi:VCBS repeat-containing protein [Thermoleophilia bacterium SCSIO 60948]|nr:VCBS repeat-containing protein [Thermoleophilia bacterium SCSIO 60948]
MTLNLALRATLTALAVLAGLPAAASAAPAFAPGEEFDGMLFPNDSLELADLDRDGSEDAVTVGLYDACSCGELRINFGGRDGLTDRTKKFYAGDLGDLELADLNRDGRQDIAVQGSAASARGRLTAGVVLYLSRSEGGYARRVYRVGRNPSRNGSLATGDLDRDGRPDLVVHLRKRIRVLLGDGHGHFSAGVTIRSEGAVTDVLVADLDRDGLLDIVARTAAGIETFRGRNGGRFGPGAQVPSATAAPGGEMVTSDIDRDGDRDLLVPNGGRVTVFANDLDGGLSVSAVLETGYPDFEPVDDVEVADLDGNGSRDVLLAYGRALQYWSGDGQGGFSFDSEIPATEQATGVATTDFDADGELDLAVQREEGGWVDRPTQLLSLLQVPAG